LASTCSTRSTCSSYEHPVRTWTFDGSLDVGKPCHKTRSKQEGCANPVGGSASIEGRSYQSCQPVSEETVETVSWLVNVQALDAFEKAARAINVTFNALSVLVSHFTYLLDSLVASDDVSASRTFTLIG
jgi:hypothetical protein